MHWFQDGDAGDIFCGDAADVIPERGIKADLIVTSPPYGNVRDYGGHQFDFERVADACVSALAEGGALVWIVEDTVEDRSKTGASFKQALHFMERGLPLHDTMVYRKRVGGRAWKNRHQNGFAFMFVFGSPKTVNIIADVKTKNGGQFHGSTTYREKNGETKPLKNGYRIPEMTQRDNVWTYDAGFGKAHPRYTDAHKHPATFPYRLAVDHILTWSNPGDIALDPMAGSGTTLRAAKDHGRRYVGIEIHKPYFDLAVTRMAQGVLV